MNPFRESKKGVKAWSAVARLLACFALLAAAAQGCGEKGEEGTTAIDCGEHGSAHGDHCHCDQGFLFDSATCVLPEDIDVICEAHADESVDADDEGLDAGHEDEAEEEHDAHAHGACRCPIDGECHCDHGTIEAYGGVDYCVPELHAE